MAIYQQDWIAKWAVYSPEKIAFKESETGKTLTYGQLHRLANRLAVHWSAHLGLKKGDRVAIVAENGLAYPILFAAAQKTGVILVPINYRLTTPEIDYLLHNAEPRLAIVQEQFASTFIPAAYGQKLAYYWSLSDLDTLCDPNQQTPEDASYSIVPVEPDHPIFILYTSGTTGFPKGAVYSHKMLLWNSINTAMSLIINSESRTVNCMPPFHTGGWNVLMTPFMHHGGYTCLMRKFDPQKALQLLQTERCTLFMAVPTMLKQIAEAAHFGQASFKDLYYLIVGGEPMPVPLIEQWSKKKVPVRQGYGMTEVGPNLTSLHQDDAIRKKGSIGRPNFYVDIRIVDSTGQDVPVNRPGELLLKGPMVTPGYWKNAEATNKAIKAGWFHSGDLVRKDEEGYLYVVDRIKNMFISGGENVYPAEIERVIQQHPAVSEVAVIGVADIKWGEVGCAFVVCRSGQSLMEEEIRNHCLERLARFKVPKRMVFVDILPKNDTGKIDRQTLRQDT